MLSRRAVVFQLPSVLVAAFSSDAVVNSNFLLPKPRFSMNQRVRVIHGLESCPELAQVVGIVQGMMWQPEEWRVQVGWVYDIHFFPNSILGDDSWREQIPESEIYPV